MHIRNLVSPIALAAALSLSGGAMAQTTIAGMEIPAADLPQVQAHCDSLAAATTESLTDDAEDDDVDAGDETGDDDTGGDDDGSEPGPNDDGDDDASGDDGSGEDENDPASEDGEASDLDNALTSIDLDAVTLEDCREAGLVE